MSTVTPNLGLFKYNTTTDANSAFNINKALNNNWDIIDEAITGGSSRNIGEIVTSTVPLIDAGLHLLDGALIQGSGIYSDFVDYISNLYEVHESSWTQPMLTSNTSYGTVSSTSVYSTGEPWKAFNGTHSGSDKYLSNSTSGGNITWHLPKRIKISSCKVYTTEESNYLNRFPRSISLSGSNDGTNWESLCSATSYSQPSSGSYVEITVADPSYYIYYKWDFGSVFSGGNPGVAVSEIEISAKETQFSPGFTDETSWQTSVTNYGVCGKFVYDSVNNTVRLPKVTGIIEGTTDLNALGDLVEAGLPDHTHTLTVGANAGSSWPSTYKAAWGNDDQYRDANKSSATTNSASACNPIYGNSDTVQPQTIKALYYIVIATSTKTNIQVDIDNIVNEWNNRYRYDSSTETLYIGTLA